MKSGVDDNDDMGVAQQRAKVFFQLRIEDIRVARSFEQERRFEAGAFKSRSDQRGAQTGVAGAQSIRFLPLRSTSVPVFPTPVKMMV